MKDDDFLRSLSDGLDVMVGKMNKVRIFYGEILLLDCSDLLRELS